MLDWLAFVSYVLVATFTPGPNNIMAVTNAVRVGLRKAMRFNLGVLAGFAVVMVLCSYLSLALSSLLPRFRLVMSVVGAGYLLYLAARLVWSTEGAHSHRAEPLTSFWAGLGLQFLNPKLIMYGITVFGSFVLPANQSQGFLVLVAVLLALLGFTSTTCWSLFGTVFQRLLARYHRPFKLPSSPSYRQAS
jgi:threonine/homoserine/homoserine lactone efflux protein